MISFVEVETSNDKMLLQCKLKQFGSNCIGEKTKLLIFCIGLYSLLTVNEYFQQLIFAFPDFRPFEWCLLLFQFFHYFICGWLELLCRKIHRSITPLSAYSVLGSLVLCLTVFLRHAITYLNHPVYVSFECCFMFAVMFAGIYFTQKSYSLLDYVSTLFICVGLIAFVLANTHMAPQFHALGILIMSLAAICNAASLCYQEKIMADNRTSGAEIIAFTYSFSFVYLAVILIVSRSFWNGLKFCLKNGPLSAYIVLYSLSGYLVLRITLSVIKNHNALIAIIVLTAYKVVVIILSFLRFEQSFSITYVWSSALMMMGIYMMYNGDNLKDRFKIRGS